MEFSRSEVEEKCKLSKKGGTLTERLKALEEAGFILSFLPLFHKTRGIYYKVIDEYSLFYLAWIEPEKNTLIKSEKKSNFWKYKHKTPAWHIWSGYAFESVCYKHIPQIRRVLDIPDGSKSGVWNSRPEKDKNERGTQIDLLFDREDNAITLCEIKHSIHPFVIDKEYAKNLIHKKEVFMKKTGTHKQVFIAIIAANGIKNNLYSEDLIDGAVTLVDLFE